MKMRATVATAITFLETDQELQVKLLTMRKALWKTIKDRFSTNSDLKI